MSKVSRTDRSEPVRKQRVPVSSNRAPLAYKGLDKDNFSYRWVLDRDDRIATFLEAGYEFVKPTGESVGESTVDSSKQVGSRVTKSAGFGGLKLYLMFLPIQFYNEDQLAKQKEIDELEATMREPGKGKIVPKEGVDFGSIKLERSGMPATKGS
jgi:hypothetical protein